MVVFIVWGIFEWCMSISMLMMIVLFIKDDYYYIKDMSY